MTEFLETEAITNLQPVDVITKVTSKPKKTMKKCFSSQKSLSDLQKLTITRTIKQ